VRLRVNRYRPLLAEPAFRRLWIGSTASAIGDGATWMALSWLVYERTQSPSRVGLLVLAYGGPVLVGGLATGPLLDRFGAIRLMRLDSLFRGAVMASIPILAFVGAVPLWALYCVAASYGLLKMVPLAGVPTVIPNLTRPDQLDTANALESLSYGVSGVVAPMLAGVLIATIGSVNVLALDAASFFLFAACLYGLRDPPAPAPAGGSYGLGEAIRFLRTNVPVALTTWMFASFNVGLGGLLVVLPIYATRILDGGATVYAALTSALLAGDLVGSLVVGAIAWLWPLGRSIAAAQTAVGVAFLPLLLQPGTAATVGLLFVSGLLTSPLTIWAQSLRMRLIPSELRGRVFSLLRTIMQAAEPLGGALGGLVIGAGGLLLAMAGIAGAMGAPGLLGLLHPALAPAQDSGDTAGRGQESPGAVLAGSDGACVHRHRAADPSGPPPSSRH
jgi:predicted MFS family arabinose efflux permease